MERISVTCDVFQFPMILIKRRSMPKHITHVRHLRRVPVPDVVKSNEEACRNMEPMSVTCDVFQFPIAALKLFRDRKCTLHVRHPRSRPSQASLQIHWRHHTRCTGHRRRRSFLAETTGDRSRKRHVSEVYATVSQVYFPWI